MVDDATFDTVQERRQQYATLRPERSRRPKHILSGLAFCGICVGSWTVRGGEYWGCGRHRERGAAACSNNRTVRSDTMAERVEHGLTSQFLPPLTEARRVGQGCVMTCSYRWSSYHSKKQIEA